LFGPVHEYTAPETPEADRLIAEPEHTGELLLAVGVEGGLFTVTIATAVEEHPNALPVTV
jgi:hypothetical protein